MIEHSGKGENKRQKGAKEKDTAEMLKDWRAQGYPGVSDSGEGIIQANNLKE